MKKLQKKIDNLDFILISGISGVGKSTLCEFIHKYKKLKYINAGDCLRKFLLESNITLDERTKTGKEFLKHFREEDIFTVILKECTRQKSSVIDGVRQYSTFKEFAKKFKTKTIFVDVDWKIR